MRKNGNIFTDKKLVDLIVKNHYDGKSYAQICDVVKQSGFKNRLGKFYGENCIGRILRNAGIRKRSKNGKFRIKTPNAAPKQAPKKNVMSAVRAILLLDMDASEKVALALMVLD